MSNKDNANLQSNEMIELQHQLKQLNERVNIVHTSQIVFDEKRRERNSLRMDYHQLEKDILLESESIAVHKRLKHSYSLPYSGSEQHNINEMENLSILKSDECIPLTNLAISRDANSDMNDCNSDLDLHKNLNRDMCPSFAHIGNKNKSNHTSEIIGKKSSDIAGYKNEKSMKRRTRLLSLQTSFEDDPLELSPTCSCDYSVTEITKLGNGKIKKTIYRYDIENIEDEQF